MTAGPAADGLQLQRSSWRARARKALAAAGTAFLTTLGASLWSSAAGSALTREEVAGAVGLAVASAVAAGLAAYGVTNADQVDLQQLDVVTRRAVLDALQRAAGPKPAQRPTGGGGPPAGPGRFA